MALAEGHETPSSTMLDAEFDEILDMPSDSPWPVLLAFATLGIFVFLLVGTMFVVWICVALAALALAGWHSTEPQEA
jgi:uncharacterized membrane protein YjjP (DUF1212 family)